MNLEIRTKWIAALRSGMYLQGRGVLRTKEDTYCCLGVLCNIVDPTQWAADALGKWHHWQHDAMPSDYLLEKVDIEFEAAEELANLNDNGSTFAEIADKIEQVL